MGTPEFETIETPDRMKEIDTCTGESVDPDKHVDTMKRESPLNDLSLPATFNEQTFEPPEELVTPETSLKRDVQYLNIMPRFESRSTPSVVSVELMEIISALETLALKAVNRLASCTDFNFPH